MKYLIINGSPRTKNTWKIVKQAQKNINGEFEELHLIGEKIPLCVGCMKCIFDGEDRCPHFDKVKPIVDKIRECDAMIITSPVYAMNVSGILKNFFDHTAYLYHRPEFFTKKALVVVSTAGAGHKKVAKYIDETLRHWGFNRVYSISMACGGKDFLEEDKIDKVSKNFSADVESNKLHSPKLSDIVFFNVWKAIAVSKEPIEIDKKYWYDRDLISHDFSPAVKLGIFKTLFSKLMYFLMKKFIK